jgi:hypothetical protein
VTPSSARPPRLAIDSHSPIRPLPPIRLFCRHEVMSLPICRSKPQLCLFPFFSHSRVLFFSLPAICQIQSSLCQIQHPNSILICITYPLLNSPSSMFTGLQPTAYHLGCHFFPFSFFSSLAFSLFDRFNSLFNRRLANVPFFFLPLQYFTTFFLSIWLAFLISMCFSTCLGLDLLPLSI